MVAIMTKTATPFQYGATDAAAGIPCSPTLYFSHPGDQESYVAGYHSNTGAGPVPDGNWELAAPPASRDERADEAGWLVEKEHAYKVKKAFRDAELADLEEARRDEEFFRWGC